MRSALLLTIPRHAHVTPSLALARALVARGERVTCLLTPEFREAVERGGVRFQGYATSMRPFRPPEEGPSGSAAESPRVDMVGLFRVGVLHEIQHVLPQVLESARAAAPSYVLYDAFCVWGRVLARLLDVPAVALRPTYAVNERFSAGRFSNEPAGEPDPAIRAMGDRLVSDLSGKYGVPADVLESLSSHVEELNVIFLPEWFQPERAAFDDRFFFAGPAVVERDDAPSVELPPGTEPLVFVSLGTVFNRPIAFYRSCVQAFAGRPCRAAIAVGRDVDPRAIDAGAPNVRLHGGSYRLELFRHARAFLCHGGLCSVMEALSWGVPLVIVPQHPEHFLTARRVVELGLGATLGWEAARDPAVLRQTVLRVMADPELRRRAEAAGRELRALSGAERGAESILAFLQRAPGRLAPRP
jgi:MGT family glycosyltransferase